MEYPIAAQLAQMTWKDAGLLIPLAVGAVPGDRGQRSCQWEARRSGKRRAFLVPIKGFIPKPASVRSDRCPLQSPGLLAGSDGADGGI